MSSCPRPSDQSPRCSSDLGAEGHGWQDAHGDKRPDFATSLPECTNLVDPLDDLPEPLPSHMTAYHLASCEVHAEVPCLPHPTGVE
eukprot:5181566-Heterocapsa_arctica.AAC.1